MEEQRKAVWPTTINGQSLSGSTGTMETQLPSIQVSNPFNSRNFEMARTMRTLLLYSRLIINKEDKREGG
jgi:hypothetical protein